MAEYIRRPRKKFCGFCRDKVEQINYKDVGLLKKYLSEKGKIRPRRVSGNCTQHQKDLAAAIKRARQVALLSYGAK